MITLLTVYDGYLRSLRHVRFGIFSLIINLSISDRYTKQLIVLKFDVKSKECNWNTFWIENTNII